MTPPSVPYTWTSSYPWSEPEARWIPSASCQATQAVPCPSTATPVPGGALPGSVVPPPCSSATSSTDHDPNVPVATATPEAVRNEIVAVSSDVASAAPPVTPVVTTSLLQASPSRRAAIRSPDPGSATTTSGESPKMPICVAGGHPSPQAGRAVTGVILQPSPCCSATRTSDREPPTLYATIGAPAPSTAIEGAPASAVFSIGAISKFGPLPYQTPVSVVQVAWMSVPAIARSVPLACSGVKLASDGSAAGPNGIDSPAGVSRGCAT